MTGNEIYVMTNGIVEDTIEETLFYQLVNVAKDRREDMRPWQMLKKLDQTKTASVGDTYLTTKTLPSDWRYTYKMMVGTDTEYTEVPFEEQHIYRSAAFRFFIDVANAVFSLTGLVNAAKTIYHFYIRTTDDITSSTSPVWPSRFHPLLAFDVAAMYQGGIDYDDINARMSPMNRAVAQAMDSSMVTWDTNLKLKSMNNSYSGSGDTSLPLGMM